MAKQTKALLYDLIALEHTQIANLNLLLSDMFMQQEQSGNRSTRQLLAGEERATLVAVEKCQRIASLIENIRDNVYELADAHKASEAIEFLRVSKGKALELSGLYDEVRRGTMPEAEFHRKKNICQKQLDECIGFEITFGAPPRRGQSIILP